MNELYEQMNQNPVIGQFKNFMSNPMQFLMSRKINIPEQFANDPHGAVQHLLNSGQMSQTQLNNLTQMASRMGIKLQ